MLKHAAPITFIIYGDKVHDEHVVLHGVEAEEPHLEGGEHSAAGLGHDHLRAELVELLPQRLHLQLAHAGAEAGVQRLLGVRPRPARLLPAPAPAPHLVTVDVLDLVPAPGTLLHVVTLAAASRHQTC